MTCEDWTVEEQNEVMKFFQINSLQLEEWPKPMAASNSADLGRSESELGASMEIAERDAEATNSSALKLNLPPSMAYARSLLDEVKDPLGLNDSLYQMQVQRMSLDPKFNSEESSILLASPGFDPRLYLRLVHQYTSYEDLIAARESLQAALNLRRETLKSLVKQNFDRFVNAKNSIDTVYADMRVKGMNSGEFGMRPTTSALNVALEKAQQVYHPLLKRRSREDCIRKRLEVFKQYNQIFSLPAAMHAHIQLGEFQQCVWEYRKGKALLTSEPANSSLRPILEKVWSLHVEKAAAVLRSTLFDKLSSPIFPFDVQCKIVGYLLEIEAYPDPILFFFNTASTLLTNRCEALQSEYLKALKDNTAIPNALELEDLAADLIRDTVKIVQSRMFEQFYELSYPVMREWRIIADSFAVLCGPLRSLLTPMAKMSAQVFSENSRFKTLNPTFVKEFYPRKLEQATKLVMEALQSHIDVILMKRSNEQYVDNASMSMFFGLKIVRELVEALLAIFEASPFPLLMTALKNVLAYTMKTLFTRIWHAAISDCRNMGVTEDWRLSVDSFSTALVTSFESYFTFILSSTLQCRKVFEEVVGSVDECLFDPFEHLDSWITQSFIKFVVEGMYECVKTDESSGSNAEMDLQLIDEIDDSVDLLKLNYPVRLLVVLANVQYLKQTGLNRIFALCTEASLTIDTAGQMQTALNNVESAVTQLFLQSQVGRVISPIEQEWLQQSENQADSSISNAVYKALLGLSDVQALICDANPGALRSLLRELTQSLLSALLSAAKQNSSSSGPKPLLQARVDCDFLQQRLSSLISAEASLLLEKTIQIVEEEALGKGLSEHQLSDAIHQFNAQNLATLFQSFQL